MGFLKNWFGGKAGSEDKGSGLTEGHKFHSRIELVKDVLYVHLYEIVIDAQEGKIRCISYVTEGLESAGQDELVLTVKNAKAVTDPEKEPHTFFKQILMLAQQDKLVHHWGYTLMRGHGLMGWQGILYIKADRSVLSFAPVGALSMILVTNGEFELASAFGHLRILSMLAYATRFYPHPSWNNLTRKELPVAQIRTSTALVHFRAHIALAYSSVRAEGGNLLMRLDYQKEKISIPEEGIPTNMPFLIKPALDPEADGCLTWLPGQTEPVAVGPIGSKAQRLSGCFLAVVCESDTNAYNTMEDGYGLFLAKEAGESMSDALRKRQNLKVPFSDGSGSFLLEWRR